jgi:uncharacterized protein YcaQ
VRRVPGHRLTKEQARRIAVRAQLLDAPPPTDLLEVVQQLTLLQIDPTAAIAPSADLVAWSRLGSAYEPADLKRALEEDRTLGRAAVTSERTRGSATTTASGATSSGCSAPPGR